MSATQEQKGRADQMAELENNNIEEDVEKTEDSNPKTYTEEEVQSLIDRRVTQALKTQARKQESKAKEAEKLARMNEQEKYEYELEQREKALAEKERAFALERNKNIASQILADKDIDVSLADFVVAEDADTMNENIKRLAKGIAKSVEKRLAGKAPFKAPETNEGLTKEQFNKMSLNERQHLFDTDRELYNKLAQR